MQAVGELDEQHPHIGRNGEQELPQILRLRLFACHQLQPLDLGQAVDDLADLEPNSWSISAQVASVSSIVS